ncbi:MAG TPA: SAM-dependent methyltransferase [Pyrinomonadaceae bacterium]|nr:SAM-dependent methyltransferase [Pyrinomonadaceae bacterium]
MTVESVREFLSAFASSLGEGTFVRLTLGKYRGGEDLRNLYVRPADLKAGRRLSFLYRRRTRDETRNLSPDEGAALVGSLLGSEFLSAHLFTTGADLRLEFNRRREARLTRHAPTFAEAPAAAGHARRKRRLIEAEGNVYLRGLGVTDERGAVRPAMGDKFRQINKFVETLADLVSASGLAAAGREVTIADMGSGKGYLTFAVYDYLTNGLGLAAKVTGVEARPELVELCNRVAAEADFAGLRFVAGEINDYEPGAVDVLIALHACDTATDEALYKGVRGGASLVVTAPCCHKELRPQVRPPAPLRGLLRHGILLEREAESVTDSLRALLLEAAGYRVKVFEFISTEHTRKNTMIAGVRRGGPSDREEALRQFRELKEFYGVSGQRLETLLCEAGLV